jgi:hypothetical protein
MKRPLPKRAFILPPMKKVLLTVAILISVATAQKMPSHMPKDSPQYAIAQRVISAIHGFEEGCGEPSDQYRETLRREYEIYQSICGGYFVSSKTPLEEIDLALSKYKSKSAWQKVSDRSYERAFKFGSGEIHIYLFEFSSDEAIIGITYQESKVSSKN